MIIETRRAITLVEDGNSVTLSSFIDDVSEGIHLEVYWDNDIDNTYTFTLKNEQEVGEIINFFKDLLTHFDGKKE